MPAPTSPESTMAKRTYAQLSPLSRYHLDQIERERCTRFMSDVPQFNPGRIANIKDGEGKVNSLPNGQKNPRKRRAQRKCWTSRKRPKYEKLEQKQLIDNINSTFAKAAAQSTGDLAIEPLKSPKFSASDARGTKEDSSEGCEKSTLQKATPQSRQTSSQCDILQSEGFKKLPQELLDMIWWEYLQTPGRRVWVYDTAFLENGEIQFGFGTRAPLPRVMCDSNLYRRKAFKELGYVEIKKEDSDHTGLILDPLRDLIFLDQTQGNTTTGMQLGSFVAAMKRCNTQGELRSISIGRQTVLPGFLQQTMALLSEFCNLELILVAYNKRPRPSKDSASRTPFILANVSANHRIERIAEGIQQAMEDAWIGGPGKLVPHIAHVEYQYPGYFEPRD